MDNLKRRFTALGISLLTASLASARASDDQPLEIAAILSLSGAYSQVGFMEARSLHTAIEIANEHGGVNGRPLTLHLFDDESNTGQAYMLADQIVKAQLASAIIGGSTTPTCEAIHLATGPNHVVQFCLSGGQTHGSTYFSSFAAPQRVFGDIPAAFMAERRLQRVAVIVRGNHAGRIYDQAIETAVAAKNLQLIQTTQTTTDDEAKAATDSALKNRADVIYVGGDRNVEIDVLKEVHRRHKKTTVWLVDTASGSEDAMSIANVLPRGPVYSSGDAIDVAKQLPDADQQRSALVAYWQTFAKYNNGLQPNTYAVVMADAAHFIISGLRADGGLGGHPLAEAIENSDDTIGLYSTYHFSPQRHNGADLAGTIVRLQHDGSLQYVETLPQTQDTETPAVAATAAPVVIPTEEPTETPTTAPTVIKSDTDDESTPSDAVATPVAPVAPSMTATDAPVAAPVATDEAAPVAKPQVEASQVPAINTDDDSDMQQQPTQMNQAPSQDVAPQAAAPANALPAAPPPGTSTPVPIDTE